MEYQLVILHGWGLSKDRYAGLVRELEKKKISVLSLDFPGFGSTDPPDTPLTLSDYAEYLHTYLTKHRVHQPILLGHSFGGRVALKYQYLYPEGVRGLILTGTPGYTPVPKRKLMLLVAVAKIGKIFFNIPFIRNWYYYVAGAREYYRAQGPMKETFKNIVGESLVPYMETVHIPTLLVWGEGDIITPLWIARKMKEKIKNARLIVIPQSDHGVSYKQPEIFTEKIYDFVRSLTEH